MFFRPLAGPEKHHVIIQISRFMVFHIFFIFKSSRLSKIKIARSRSKMRVRSLRSLLTDFPPHCIIMRFQAITREVAIEEVFF
jgi:hypothetical protein